MATNTGMLTPVVVPDRTRINPELVYYTDPKTNQIIFGYPPTIGSNQGQSAVSETVSGPYTDNAKVGMPGTIGGGSMAQMGAIGSVLGATGPTTSPAGKAAIDRLQNQADREACNASGGFYTLGGACLTGKEAEEQVNKIMNNPDAPANNKQAAEAWLERNAGKTEDTDTGEDTSAISDEDAIASVLATVPEKLKGIITADNVIKVLEAGAGLNDPMTEIKKAMGAGVQFEWPGDWRNWKVFGPLAIPGVPLPPGIIEVTIQDIIDATGNIGKELKDFVDDPLGTLGELGDWAKDKVTGVFGGTEEDPGWGGTLGGFEDWVKGTLGGIVGGAVLVDIYDGVKDVFTSDTATTVVPGGTPPDEETTKTLKQGDDIVSLGGSSTAIERPEPDDIFGDTTDDPDDDVLFGGRSQTDVLDRERDLILPGGDDDRRKPDPVITDINTGREAVDRDQDIYIPDPEPLKPDPIVIGGNIEEDPSTTEIGGPTPTPSGGGGGGGGGGAGGTADPFLRTFEYTPTVPVAIRQQAPVDFASGLMSPTTSMDALGQLIFRNLA